MSTCDSGLALGGGSLVGESWVRVLYLDESGVGHIKRDRTLVVAGVVIHADTQWAQIASRLADVLSKAVPTGVPRPTCLHATDIYHGSGEFAREHWEKGRRNDLLAATAQIIADFQLPVIWMAVDRAEHARDFPEDAPEDNKVNAYSVCTTGCLMQAESYMRQHVTEVASVVMEQNKQLQRRIPEMVEFLRDPGEESKNLLAGWEQVMPLSKIIDNPSFQPKSGSSILQLADYCAFAIKRRLENKSDGHRLVRPIMDNLLRYDRPTDNTALWNPVHMPHKWSAPIKLIGGKFVRVADALNDGSE